jgi:hypothetical protein
MSGGKLRGKCPVCGARAVYDPAAPDPWFPFCCERCKLLDLGKWLSEEHRIEGRGEREPGDEAEGPGREES